MTMKFENTYFCGSLYKESGEWVVYIYDFRSKRDRLRYFETKKQALSYFNEYKSYK